MDNKIKINVKEEKTLRLEIPSNNGIIVINNPTQGFKNELVTMLVNCIAKNEDFDEKKITMDLINHCTNVEFDGDIFEATNLSHEAQMIMNEVLIIFQEIIGESYQLIKIALEQAKNELIQKEILDEKDDILEKAKEIQDKKEKEEKEEEITKEVSHRTVKKMPRGKKR